ncbi:MAG: PEP-CTERM sorting domain-containing protein [Pirellulales bacterium]
MLNAGLGTVEVGASFTLTIPAALSGVGGLAKTGFGTLVLGNSANAYLGSTRVSSGELVLPTGAAITATSDVVVASGATFTVASGAAVSSPVDVSISGAANISGSVAGYAQVESGGLLTGSGNIGGVELAAGGMISPGSGVGTMTAATTAGNTFAGGGFFEFQFRNADIDPLTAGTQGSAGTDWDFLNLAGGALEIAATSGDRFTIYVDSWLGDGSGHGLADNFDPMADYSWKFLEANGGITFTGGSSDVFAVDAERFAAGVFGTANPYTIVAGRGFYVTSLDNSLYLNYGDYAAVPEPSSLLLTSLAAGFWAWRRRRNRRNAGEKTEAVALCSVE